MLSVRFWLKTLLTGVIVTSAVTPLVACDKDKGSDEHVDQTLLSPKLAEYLGLISAGGQGLQKVAIEEIGSTNTVQYTIVNSTSINASKLLNDSNNKARDTEAHDYIVKVLEVAPNKDNTFDRAKLENFTGKISEIKPEFKFFPEKGQLKAQFTTTGGTFNFQFQDGDEATFGGKNNIKLALQQTNFKEKLDKLLEGLILADTDLVTNNAFNFTVGQPPADVTKIDNQQVIISGAISNDGKTLASFMNLTGLQVTATVKNHKISGTNWLPEDKIILQFKVKDSTGTNYPLEVTKELQPHSRAALPETQE